MAQVTDGQSRYMEHQQFPLMLLDQDDLNRGAPWHARAVYGPIPELPATEGQP